MTLSILYGSNGGTVWGFILILFTWKRYDESIFICSSLQEAQMHGINDIPVLLNAQKPSGTKIGCIAHFMTVNSIFNNSKMILWFGIVRYDTRSDPMPDESVNFWIFYHLNIKTVAEFGWWCYFKMVCSVFNIHFGEIVLIPSAYFGQCSAHMATTTHSIECNVTHSCCTLILCPHPIENLKKLSAFYWMQKMLWYKILVRNKKKNSTKSFADAFQFQSVQIV